MDKSTPCTDNTVCQKALQRHVKNKRQPSNHEWTPFRAAEKRYKARFSPPDLHSVLDLGCSPCWIRNTGAYCGPFGNANAIPTKPIKLRDESLRPEGAFTIPHIPGLVILPNYLTHSEQRSLIQWSLCSQARAPNNTNLDIHYFLPKDGLWNAHVSARREGGASDVYIIQPKRPTGPTIYPPEGPRPLIDNTPIELSNFDAINMQPKPLPPPSSHLPPIHASKLLYKLRWANIGYFYHWGSKTYDFTKSKTDYPRELRDICKDVVASIDWHQVWEGVSDEDWGEQGPEWEAWPESYEPDAGIVNFYQLKDTLCGHVDRSEVCATSPLVSMSLGNAAIFLIGGVSRSIEPLPILLRSGDIVIMSGPSCRRAYHGVPRVLENTLPEHLRTMDGNDDWRPFSDYLQTTRININVRQVFPRGFVLSDSPEIRNCTGVGERNDHITNANDRFETRSPSAV